MTASENDNVEQALRDAIRTVVDRIERDGIPNEAPGSAAWCHDYTEAIYEQVAAVVAGVRAEAWDEGYVAGGEDWSNAYWSGSTYTEPNPYRERADRETP